MGCSSPVGSIEDSGGNGNGDGKGDYNFLMLTPNRQLYAIKGVSDNRFDRLSDFQAYAANGGPLIKLDPADSNLTIEILSAPGFLGAEVSEKVQTVYPFALPGRYIIKGTYFGNTDDYSIEVEGEFSEPGDEYDFGGIMWL